MKCLARLSLSVCIATVMLPFQAAFAQPETTAPMRKAVRGQALRPAEAAAPGSPAAAPDSPAAAKSKKVKRSRAVSEFRALQLKEGTNTVKSLAGGYKLVAHVSKGQVPHFQIVGPGGAPVPSTDETTIEKGKTTCWRCFVDGNGDKHCVEIPCPTDTRPWPGGDVAPEKAIQ